MNRDQHIISLTTGGLLAQSGRAVSSRTQLAGILAAFAASGKPSITLCFHGGIVNEEKGLAQAERLYPELSDNAQTFPVFIVWRSGVLEVLQGSLLDIVQGSPLFRQVLQKLLKHVLRKFPAIGELVPDDLLNFEMASGAALVDAPLPETQARLAQLRADLEAERPPFEDAALLTLFAPPPEQVDEVSDADLLALQSDLAADATANYALNIIATNAARNAASFSAFELAPGETGATAPSPETGYLSGDLLRELQRAQPPAGVDAEFVLSTAAWAFAGRILRAVINRYRTGSDHGLVGTVLEEMYRAMYADKIGRFLWDGIKSNAANAYADNPAATTNEAERHGMTLFIDLLRDHIRQHGKITLNLVGHSAGAIHICHFVERARRTLGDDFIVNVVTLTAPACTAELFRDRLLPSLDRISTLRIFNLQDELERADPVLPLIPFAYPHSLLYFVSGLLEEKTDAPLLGMTRFLRARQTSDKDLLVVRDLIEEGEKVRLVLSETPDDAPVGEQSLFTSHYGDKGPLADAKTLNSIAALIRPLPQTDLQPLEPAITQEMAALLQPSASVLLGAEPAGVHSTDDLLSWQLGGGPADETPTPNPPTGELSPLEMDDLLEAIIGENEIVDHRFVKGLLHAGRAVARIVVSGVVGFDAIPPDQRAAAWRQAVEESTVIRAYGTGWIFGRAKRLLITNNHVLPLPEAVRTASAEFGYENDLRAVARPQRVLGLDPDAFFLTSPNLAFGGLDYTFVALNPAQHAAGMDDIEALEPVQGVTADNAKNIYIVQHPKGDPKAYVLNHNRKVNLDRNFITYISDTLRGSSGSPLFNDDLRLVGIHHVGNHTVTIGSRTEQTNLGSRIEVVMQDVVRQLRARSFTGEQVEYWFGQGALLNLWRR